MTAPHATSPGEPGRPTRRTNPLSPLIQAVPALPAAALFFLGPGSEFANRSGIPLVPMALAGAVIGYAAVAAVAWLSWWRRTFWIDDDGDLHMDSGIIQRSARRLQLSRLQSVDIVAPMIARLVGLVELRVEVAGTGDSRIVMRYVTRQEADALRALLLDLSRGSAGTEQESGDPLASVPSGRLLAALLMRSATVALILATVALVVITSIRQGAAGLLLAVVTGGLPILSVASEYLSNHGFTVDRTRDGLRIRRGLLSTQTRTLPSDRVHAVGIVEPLLWRRWDWVRVTVTIAGVRGEEGRPEVLIPVAPRSQALDLIAEVLPGVDIAALDFEAAPRQSRWRSPLEWRMLGCAITPEVIASRSGRITRRISVALHARVQSVRVTEGPWERRLGLCTLHADTAPGPVHVAARHLGRDEVAGLAREETERMRRARRVR